MLAYKKCLTVNTDFYLDEFAEISRKGGRPLLNAVIDSEFEQAVIGGI